MPIKTEAGLKVATALELVHHVLAGRPSHRIGGGMVILNLAGQQLVNSCNWNWLVGTPIFVDLRAQIELAGATWDNTNRQLTKTGAFAGYEHVRGDYLNMTSGAGVTAGTRFEVEKKQSDDILLLLDSGLATGFASDVAAVLVTDRMRLPDDFRSLAAWYATNGLVNGLVPTTIDGIMRRRALAYVTSIGNYWFAVVNAQAKGANDGPPHKVFELWPSATASSPSFFSIAYYADWQQLDADDTYIQIPEWIMPLYVEVLRGVALGLEENEERTLPQQMAEVFNPDNPTFQNAKNRDAEEQMEYGPIEGGAAQQYARSDSYLWNFGEIAGPS